MKMNQVEIIDGSEAGGGVELAQSMPSYSGLGMHGKVTEKDRTPSCTSV